MVIIHALAWVLLIVEICIAFPIVYLCVLSCSALLEARKRTHEVARADHKRLARNNFALLIPAHDEEVVLGGLLESLFHLDYPKELYTIYVIADNCTDTTADLARQFHGVCVYERFDKKQRGKGYALNWMLQQLKKQTYDAYVIIDADSVVEPTFLRIMDRELLGGSEALQAHYTVLNADESPSTVLRWIALTLVNHLRPLGRNGIGGSSSLAGNGMCFSYNFLQRHPWQAFGVTEDYQYYLALMRQGEHVRYVPDAIVRSQMPTTFAQMRTQDIRWEAAEPEQSQWQIAHQLLSIGLRTKSFVHIEAAMELLTPPLSFLMVSCFIVLVVALCLWSLPQIVFSIALLAGVVFYIATGFSMLQASPAVYKALLHAPGFMLWKLWVYFVLSKSRKHNQEWIRTARTPS